MRAAVLVACAVTAGALAPVVARSATTIARIERAPAIDGTLRDPAWERATAFTAFRMLHPDMGRAPSVRTEVRLACDRSHLFVGIRCLDQDSTDIRARAMNPDGIGDDDWAAFCIDTQADALGAHYFVVTPRGVRRAGLLDFDGDPTVTRDLEWTSAASISAHEYSVTMAIPLGQLPYASGDSVVMAFKAARFLQRAREEDDFPEIRDGPPHLVQLQRVVLRGIEPSRATDEPFAEDLRRDVLGKLARSEQLDFDTFEGRVQSWHGASVLDYRVFPWRPLHASRTPFHFASGDAHDSAGVVAGLERLDYAPGYPVREVTRFLTRTQTQSFLVVRNDTILYERYFNGYGRDSLMTSFSVAKSFASTLVGIAIDRGLIHGVDDPITSYLPELARRDSLFRRITIAHLLHMTSGLRYVEGPPSYDNDITYLDPHLRQAALEKTGIVEPPGGHWLYNNYNPLLVGMILERVSGRSVTALLQAWLWDPLGMEFDGSWSIDSRQLGLEKMESGINARAVDLAKLGAMFLHEGRWRGARVVSDGWVRRATQPQADAAGFYGGTQYFGEGGHYYGWFWWGSRRADGASDFFAVGNKGQYIYCSPRHHVVIVRTGMQFGVPTEVWAPLFRELADGL